MYAYTKREPVRARRGAYCFGYRVQTLHCATSFRGIMFHNANSLCRARARSRQLNSISAAEKKYIIKSFSDMTAKAKFLYLFFRFYFLRNGIWVTLTTVRRVHGAPRFDVVNE